MFHSCKIDKSSKTPIYMQIVEMIKESLSDGVLHIGEKLPSQRRLMENFGVSRNTILTAMDILSKEGFIDVKPQSGARIADNSVNKQKNVKSPDWDKYFRSGMHRYGMAQRVEQLTVMGRSRKRIINISQAGLGSEFNLIQPILNLLEQKVLKKDLTTLRHFNKYGYPPLCEIIAQRAAACGINISAKQVLIIPSVLQGINLSCIAFLRQGSNFVYAKPNVINMDSIVHYTGCNMIGTAMDNDGIIPEKLDLALKAANSFLYLNPTCQNPTGRTMSMERRRQVLEIANRRRVPIIEVDSLRDIDSRGVFPPSLRALDKADSVIYHGSILRTLNFNLGVSWIIASEEAVEHLSDVKAQADMYPSIILQLIAEELLAGGHYDVYLKDIRPIIEKKQLEAAMLLNKYFKDIASWRENECSYYIWLKFDERVNTKKLFEAARDIEFYPGFFFDKSDISHISICPAGVTFEELDEGLCRLNQNIRKLFRL